MTRQSRIQSYSVASIAKPGKFTCDDAQSHDRKSVHWPSYETGAKGTKTPQSHRNRVCVQQPLDRSQHGSRSPECKPWRHKSIWREWLLLSSWFSLRNRQENVWRFLRQRKEIGARKGLHRVHLWWKVKAFYWGHDEPCASLFLIEVSRTLAQPKKTCSLCVRLW